MQNVISGGKNSYLSSKGNLDPTEHPIFLSIAVPTFNRASELALLFQNFIDRLTEYNSSIEIIISDNCSADSTWTIVTKFQEELGDKIRVRAFRQNFNLGPHRNVTFLLDQAFGDYVWTIADDDVLAEGAISKVFECLKSKAPKALLVRAKGIGEWDSIESDIRRTFKTAGPSDFNYVKYLVASSFLASVIFKRTEYISRKKLLIDLAYTNYPHLILFWHICLSNEKVSIVDSICVKGNANFSGNSIIPSFGVLVHARGVIWSTLLSGSHVKIVLKDYISSLYVQGWLTILVGEANDVSSRSDKVKAAGDTWRILGVSGWKSYILFVSSLLIPLPKLFRAFKKLWKKYCVN